eukprot:jgi/Chrpa1/25516/Chrysochromulina_OHIO_Genome00026415-RA
MLAEVAKQKGISLCGIQRDQTTADFHGKGLKPPDAILLGSDLSQAVVTGALTSINLSRNQLCGVDERGQGTYTAEGITAIADALRGSLTSIKLKYNQLGDEGWGAIFAAICGNKDSKIMSLDASFENISPAGIQLIAEALRTSVTGGLTSIDLSGNRVCGIWTDNSSQHGTYTAEGITAIAYALRVNGGLTSVNLKCNQLRDEGWGAIFAAICVNKDSKIMSLDASSETIGPAGVKLIAEALRTSVTGSLTVTNLLGNQLDAESAKMLAEVAKQKGISLCGIRRDQTTSDFFYGRGLNPPDAILLASDLSQAVVTGALTQLDLSGNQLCGVRGYGQGTFTAEGITAIADALRVNGALTVTNLLGNQLDAESAKMLAEVAKQKGISLCGIQRDQTT